MALALVVMGSLTFTGCSDDLEVKDPDINREVNKDEILLNISVPEESIVKTRVEQSSTEMTISSSCKHYALIYEKDGANYVLSSLAQEIVISDTQTSVAIKGSSSFNAANSKIIVVANVPNNTTETSKFTGLAVGSNYTALLSKLSTTLSNNTAPGSPFIMSAVAKEGDNSNEYDVDLTRSVARISVEVDDNVGNFVLEGYEMRNAPNQGYYTAGVAFEENLNEYIYNSGTQKFSATKINDRFQNYSYPVNSLGSSTDISAANAGAYFIVEGKFEGETCYYRVDLRGTKKSDGSYEYYNINPNHWYQIEIIEVYRKGYSSADEAAQRYMGQEDLGNSALIDVKIHDHVSAVMSMTTDGIRELGADREIKLTTNSSTGILTVKCFSKNGTTDQSGKPVISSIKGNWIDITYANNNADSKNSEQTSGDQDADSQGIQWSFPIKPRATMYSDNEATIKITWHGLERTVVVKFEADFIVSQILDASLTIYEGASSSSTTSSTKDNYWTYLSSTVKGISVNDLADGKVRDEGFHFPMPYGTNDKDSKGKLDNPWEYEYALTFKAVGGSNVTKVEYSVSNDSHSFFNDLIYTSSSANSGTLKINTVGDNKKDYDYATGTIDFLVTYANGSEIPVSLSLYRTGFFYTENSTTYYYEVIKMGSYYWLDRNLRAQSNMMYSNMSGTNGGNTASAGTFYKIANKGDYNNVNSNPTILHSSVCPPGYHIPTTTEWDNLRLSANFMSESVTQNGVNFITTYYNTGNAESGNVYFPKARFNNSPGGTGVATTTTVNSGDAGAGYYWTSTTANGLEKEEIGCWLKAMNLSGTANTYINGSIENHKMNVRCVAGPTPPAESKHAIDFNVKGATHVYLYTMDEETGIVSGLFSFPGKAIGSQDAVDALDYSNDNSYLHFSYNSTISKDNLYVFFTYVTSEGKITILDTNTAHNSTLSSAVGWPVKVGYNYFFTKPSDSDAFTPVPGGSKKEFPWAPTGTTEETVKSKFYSSGMQVTLKWYKKPYGIDTEYKKAYVWFPNNAKPLGEWKDIPEADNSDNTYFYKTFTVPAGADSDSFGVIFTEGDSSNQTKALTVGKEDGKTNNTSYTISKSGNNVTITFGFYYKQ